MNIYFFIIWLIGAIVSCYTIFKYVEPIKMIKHIWNIFNEQTKIFDKTLTFICLLFIIFLAIPGYIMVSWFGAIITYVIFTDFKK